MPDALRLAQIGASAVHAAAPERAKALLDELAPIAARDPKNPAVAFVRGQVLRAARRLPEAVEAFRAAWELGRDDPETVLLWAGSLADQGGEERLREAAAVIEAGLKTVGDEVRLLCLLARLLRDVGDTAKGDEALARAKASVRDSEDEARLAGGCR
jgi:predicted Zn-dependent protease